MTMGYPCCGGLVHHANNCTQDIRRTFKETMGSVVFVPSLPPEYPGTSLGHFEDMLSRFPKEDRGKANRWLGYLHGVLVARGLLSLEDVIRITKKYLSERDDYSSLVTTPWTRDFVDALNKRQALSYVHPYTCGNCSDVPLIATVRGWICPYCSYTQSWAHYPIESLGG